MNLAKKIVVLAITGLERSAPKETRFLNVLKQRILNEQKTAADSSLENCRNSTDKVFEQTKN